MTVRAAVALTLLSIATPASAEHIYSASANFGYAAEIDAIGNSKPSNYRYGFGLRAGVSFPKLYVGLSFARFVGLVDVARGPGSSYESTHRTWLFGPEVGYDAPLGRYFVLRPYLGVGALYEYARTRVQDVTANDDQLRLQITPGLLLLARVGVVSFGTDVRVVVSPLGAPVKWAPGAFVTAGVSF